MNKAVFFGMNLQERDAFMERQEVREFWSR